ncbi:MAG: alpha/beta hydrolase [Acidimicrobiia bacterium]
MIQRTVEFFSEGTPIAGILRLPDRGEPPFPAVVQGPGWLGLKDAQLYMPYHEALTAAGFAVLIFDYRGFGDSGGDRGQLLPNAQLDDMINAVSFLMTREDVDPDRIGTFGSGGTGAGNSIMLAAHDRRVRCVVSQVPVADGEDWLRRMRREHEWYEFLDRINRDRARRVTEGAGELVHPSEDIMIATPERRVSTVKQDVGDRVPSSVPLRVAEAIMAYKPIDVVGKIAPRPVLIIGVEDDPVTPTDHALALYEAAGEPKALIMQRHTTHYAAYSQHGGVVIPEIVAWFEEHLRPVSIMKVESTGGHDRRAILKGRP